jgi:hypothetical protein
VRNDPYANSRLVSTFAKDYQQYARVICLSSTGHDQSHR